MKKLNLILIIQLFYLCVFSQQYIPFPVDSARWGEYHWQSNFKKDLQYYTTWQKISYYLNGDTLINDTLFHKLYKDQISGESKLLSNGQPKDVKYDGNYQLYGFMREDNKIIYFSRVEYPQEFILYNFNDLNIGDSIYCKDPYSYHYNSAFPVISIDSIYRMNSYHKRYYIGAWTMDSLYFIEGIGSTTGLFPSYEEFEWGDDLVCFIKNNEIVWNQYSWSECYDPLNFREMNMNKFSVFPNPAKDILFIQNTDNINESIIELYDILGKLVIVKKLFGQNLKLDISNIKPGFYLLNFKNQRQVYRIIIE